MRRVLAQVMFGAVTLFTACVLLVLRPFDRRWKNSDAASAWWARSLFRLAGVGFVCRGPAAGSGPYVVMANHHSMLDPLLLWQLPLHLRFVAKKELLWVPGLGLGMWITGHIFIDRGQREKAIASLRRAAEKIKAGTSVLIFPEGTRSHGIPEPLLPFKKGGFMLAIEAGVPILPVGIAGTAERLPKGAWFVKKGSGKVACLAGDPVPTQGLGPEDRDKLMEEVRLRLTELRGKAQRLLDNPED